MNRRTALIGSTGVVAVAAAGAGGFALWSGNGGGAWREAVAAIRAPIAPGSTGPAALRELARYGSLAANSHNAQAWRFVVGEVSITIEPDFTRRTPNVDPDDHHLFASIGAATENIVQAAPLLGLVADPTFESTAEGRVIIALDPGGTLTSPMADAIPKRQCTRSIYDGRPVPDAHLQAIAAAGRSDGVELVIVSERAAMNAIGALIIEGNTVQMNDPAFRDELMHWLRFSYADAVSTGDGLFSAVSGNPVLPAILGPMLFPMVATADGENEKCLAQIGSSSGLAVFVSAQNDKAHWVAAGRAYQRFALQATTLGIKHAFLNQAVEVAAVRSRLAQHLSLGERRPDLIVRFGYADDMPGSMRRPQADVVA